MSHPHQFVRFCVVGLSNTALSLVVFVIAVSAGVPYLAASCAAFAAGAINGYTFNRVWTFKAGSFRAQGLARYGAVQGLGLGLNVGLLAALVEVLNLPSIPAQAVVLPVISVITFALNRRWTFGRSAQQPVHVGRVLLADGRSRGVDV